VTRSEIFEDEPISEELLRERRIPAASFNVDLAETVGPELVFRRVEEEFQRLGLEVKRLTDIVAPYETYSRAHIRVSNRRTGEHHMEKLVVVLVEGKFVSITTFP
jgi:hypothetical protein